MFCSVYFDCDKISGINRRIFARSQRSNYFQSKKQQRIKKKTTNENKLHFITTYYFINYAEIQDHGT